MAETTPNQSEPADNKNVGAPKPPTGLPPKSPPPPGAGGPPKSPPPPGAGAPPKSPAPPGAGGPPKAPPPPGAGGPPKAPAPPAAAGPPKATPPPAASGPAKAPAPPAAVGLSKADNPLGLVPRPSAALASAGALKPAGTTSTATGAAPVAATGTESTVSRREFLNYVWGASMALFLVQFGGLSFFFALPRARLGEFGGVIPIGIQQFIDAAEQKIPIANNAGKFWIVNTEQGINALYKVCTHLGCIYPWSDAASIFACPCHGSQFHLNGDYIAGPAPRALDRFQFEVHDAGGAVIASGTDGQAIPLPANAATILVDTGKKVTGKSHL